MQCKECFRNRFDEAGICKNCGQLSFESDDAIKQAEYDQKKKEGKL
jgi:hypothetical protein